MWTARDAHPCLPHHLIQPACPLFACQVLAVEGIVICSVDVGRHPDMIRAVAEAAAPGAGPAAAAAAARAASQRRLKANVRVTTRGMWVGLGDRLLEQLHAAAKEAVERLPGDAALSAVERVVADALRRTCKVIGVPPAGAVAAGRWWRLAAARRMCKLRGLAVCVWSAAGVLEEAGRQRLVAPRCIP